MSHLTQEQRYTIEVLHKENYSQTAIAERIGRCKSVVYRELQRNCDKRNGSYRASLAQHKCEKRHSEKNKNKAFTNEIKEFVIKWIKEDYSPEQIVGKAKLEGFHCVSIERIYQFIWVIFYIHLCLIYRQIYFYLSCINMYFDFFDKNHQNQKKYFLSNLQNFYLLISCSRNLTTQYK